MKRSHCTPLAAGGHSCQTLSGQTAMQQTKGCSTDDKPCACDTIHLSHIEVATQQLMLFEEVDWAYLLPWRKGARTMLMLSWCISSSLTIFESTKYLARLGCFSALATACSAAFNRSCNRRMPSVLPVKLDFIDSDPFCSVASVAILARKRVAACPRAVGPLLQDTATDFLVIHDVGTRVVGLKVLLWRHSTSSRVMSDHQKCTGICQNGLQSRRY